MKSLPILLAALLAIPVPALAGDPVKIDVYLGGELEQTVSLAGANATAKLTTSKAPNATLEFHLIAPEPLIFEVKEVIAGSSQEEAAGRVVLFKTGNSFDVSEIKGSKFRNAYVLVRHD
ncbi:hypothetical protein ACLIKD_10995 [Azonexus sp. IMCC34842]|uniref:hypothetical protein n=1 Tax=Azonexaceae TaxID=2008795 RepID=UPI001CF80480|nr:hypothetical protein [Dechloromonas denitrificans]UCV02117.1 hypothetical protein KI611_13540 [Dechloromonas denitrificans]